MTRRFVSAASALYLLALPFVASAADEVVIKNPLGANDTLCKVLKAVLNVMLQLGVPVIILFLVFAGFRFVIAKGNSEALKRARENLLYTLIGIGIFLGAYTLAMVVSATISQLEASTGNSAGGAC